MAPAAHARFLAQELSEVFRGTLLVVMPSGFGMARVGTGPATALSAGPVPVPAPGSGAALGGAAIEAVKRLAAASGHRLPAPRGATSGQASVHSATGVVAWLAFAVGAILITAAWTVSLRQRPLRQRDGVASSHGS